MDNAKKRRIKKRVAWICVGLVVLLLAVMPLAAGNSAQTQEHQASLLSGAVTTGSVSMELRGGGTLSAGDAEEVKLPTGVKLTEFLVKNGDTVSQGDPLAQVDLVSVMDAITQVQETLETLESQMEDVKTETAASTVQAKAGGRVKVVYAQAGDDVQQVMLEHGALAVLSLDSLMAVDLEGADVTTGDAVEVTLADGTVVSGRVESSLGGQAVITVEDEGYAPGETVTIRDEDGETLGTGALYIHSAWSATAFTGTVSTVWVKEESTVYAGGTLFSLTDTEYTAQLDALTAQHREYEEQLQELFQMYENGTIDAPCDGLVSGVDEDSPYLLAAQDADGTLAPLTASTGEVGWTLTLLSNVEQTPSDPPEEPTDPSESSKPSESTEPTEPVVPTGYVGYAGRVTGVGANGLILSMNETPYPVTYTQEGGWDTSQVSQDPALMLTANVLYETQDTAGYTVGDIVVMIYDEAGAFQSMVTVAKADPEPSTPDPTTPSMPGGGDFSGGMPDISGMLGGLTGGMSGMGGMTGSTTVEPELYDLTGSVLLTVTTQDVMTLTLTVDEQDISQVDLGQTAQVEVTALRGQSFEGTVTKVSTTGVNSGGSSKFSVEVTIPKAEQMLAGMSATATLPLYTKMDVLTIPVAALTEDGAVTTVYTALDEKTGEPTAPVEVTVGISDGETAEVLSGLDSGDSYYYYYYDTLELSQEVERTGISFGGA